MAPLDEVPLVPRTVLFGNPERTSPRVSPDGRRLAWIAPSDGVLNVWVGDVGADPSSGRVVTDDRERGIRAHTWAHDGRHLLYAQDAGGDEDWHLYAVDLVDGGVRDVTPFDHVQVRLVAVDKRFPDTILVAINRDDPRLHDVYRLDLPSGTLDKVVDNPGYLGFLADDDFRVRAAVEPLPDGGLRVLVRDDEDGEWRPLLDVPHEDALSTDLLSFTADGTALYVLTSAGANATRLVRVDCATGEQVEVAGDETYDVGGVRLHPDTNEPQLVSYVRERIDWEVLDPAVAADLDAVRALDGGDLVLQGHDDADRVWLAGFTADDGPVRYFAYDRDAGEGTFLFEHQPELGRYRLAPMEPFSFTARDGLTIHGYLTFPPGEERSGLPAVLNVHGGPWARDTWGLHPEAQWMANRGYLCIQVNFRGSTGYGKAFVNAGNREWAGRMHDDLVDAVGHVVGQGWADPGRIAIYGGSYGGYAALVGATFTPDLFRCAVDIVGPSNLKTLIESIPPYWAPLRAQFLTRVGDPDTEAEFMWSRSPLSRVDRIRIPLLIAQGANDPRVKQAESEQIVAALRDKGVDHEYLLFPDEGHGFAKPENRLRFYAAAERFLARHLGGRAED
ncbi:MAG TPA: S9 family peptidase [Acidimicrobiales bacterium]|jgi:dipeptidyl aminopeptidase/acylaminoacyl peptidase